MARKKISPADFALLRLDDPDNRMIITGLMTFSGPLDYQRLKSVLVNSLLRFDRFRQRLRRPGRPFARPYWVEDPFLELDAHLARLELPFPAGQAALQDLVSAIMSTGLDRSRPLWKFYLIENYGTGSALIIRLHHSLADGISLIQVLRALTETDPDSDVANRASEAVSGSPLSPVDPVTRVKSSAPQSKIAKNRAWMQAGLSLFLNRSHARHRARQAIGIAATVGDLVLRWPDPRTRFKGPLGREKRAAWSQAVDLDEVKMIGRHFHGTVSDVLIAAVAGGIGRYLGSTGSTPGVESIRAFIPVNLRTGELDEELGNKFGVVLLSLPIGIEDPAERLRIIKGHMDDLKSSSEPVAGYAIINLLGAVPARVEQIAVDFIDTKGSVVLTNVPGPQTQLYLAGAPMKSILAWVPQVGRVGLGVSITSYNGNVWLGVASDDRLVPDPGTLITFFHKEFDEMKARTQDIHLERQDKFQPLLSTLDQTIDTLDELLAEARKA